MPPVLVACITASMPKPLLTLTAFRAAALGVATADCEPPTRLLVHPWGSHDVGRRGKSIVSASTLAGFSASQEAIKVTGHAALDFRHNTVPGTPAYLADKEPRKVAAYGAPEIVDGEGIYLTGLTWTPEGRDAFLGGHFKDISPAVFRDAAGNVVALHSAALCDHGEIDGLTIEAAKAPANLAPFFAALSADTTPPGSQKDSPMKPTPSLIALLALLGVTLAPDADETATDKALVDLAEKIKAEKDKEDPAGKPSDITALAADFEKRLKAVEADRDQARRDSLKAAALAAGKVIPLDDKTWNLTPLSICESLVAGLEAGRVPMTNKTPTTEVKPQPDTFTPEALAVFAKMGVTEEEVRKFNPKPV